MALLDKLRDIYAQPADADLLNYFGIDASEPLRWDARTLTVGNETVTIEAARRAMFGVVVPTNPDTPRAVRIEDL